MCILRYSNGHDIVLTSFYCQYICMHAHAFVSLCVQSSVFLL